MWMRHCAAAGALVMAVSLPSAAQTRGAVVVKGGASIERAEDQTEGEAAAFGAGLLLRLNDRWDLDGEFWLPAYFTAPGGYQHRDIVWGIGVRRLFGDGATKPFVGFGFGGAVTQERGRAFGDTSNTGVSFYFGGGVDVPIGDRFSLVPEVRLTLAPGLALVRPSVGFAYRF